MTDIYSVGTDSDFVMTDVDSVGTDSVMTDGPQLWVCVKYVLTRKTIPCQFKHSSFLFSFLNKDLIA